MNLPENTYKYVKDTNILENTHLLKPTHPHTDEHTRTRIL